jgi:hypothetical protein
VITRRSLTTATESCQPPRIGAAEQTFHGFTTATYFDGKAVTPHETVSRKIPATNTIR